MTNLETIKDKLLHPSSYLFLPASMKDAPMPFDDMEKKDEEGNGTGEYLTPNELSSELGDMLVLKDRVNGAFFIMRYGLDTDTVHGVTQDLKNSGLVDIRANEDGTLKLPSELDYASFVGNEFMIVPPHLAKQIPINVAVEEKPIEEDE